MVPSSSRANKAGDRLRRMYEARGLMPPNHDEEMAILAAWRSQFSVPMAKTGMSLRSCIRTTLHCSPDGLVAQRQKREQQILAKLIRSRTRLSKMEDIGGCRAVLPNLASVQVVRDRLESHARTVEIVSEDDYITSPRVGGYRALHLHTMRDGVPIEVQLRTARQHRWAEQVETWDSITGHDIKHEDGPSEIVQAFKLAADYMYAWDSGEGGTIWASLIRDRAQAMLDDWIRERRRV